MRAVFISTGLIFAWAGEAQAEGVCFESDWIEVRLNHSCRFFITPDGIEDYYKDYSVGNTVWIDNLVATVGRDLTNNNNIRHYIDNYPWFELYVSISRGDGTWRRMGPHSGDVRYGSVIGGMDYTIGFNPAGQYDTGFVGPIQNFVFRAV